jgi:hypothetical protein
VYGSCRSLGGDLIRVLEQSVGDGRSKIMALLLILGCWYSGRVSIVEVKMRELGLYVCSYPLTEALSLEFRRRTFNRTLPPISGQEQCRIDLGSSLGISSPIGSQISIKKC